MKKFLSLFLTIALLISIAPISLFCITASAAESGYYTYTVSNGEATITDVNTAISGAVTIPSTLGGYPVTSIGSSAFEECTGLTSITISDGVTSIGVFAFSYCTDLTSITIPGSVTSIGNFAFRNCSGLTSIIIPDGVTSIGTGAFSYCTGLTSINISGGVTYIGEHAFYRCSGLTSITISGSVTSIGRYAFSYCSGLTSINIPGGVTSIGDYAFYSCDSLKTVFFKGTREQKETMTIGTNNNALDCAQWHYEVENTVFANQECYYCKECNDYYLYDGSHATATVIFKNWDGTELSKQTYRYNDEITVPPTPQKQSDSTFEYTFAGWDKEVVNCAGDAVYTAIYTPQYIDYTVSFKDWDGTIISSQTYHHGDKVTVPADPTKAADNTYTYAFAGWDKTVVDCVGDATYTATYTSTYINYTVVFKDWNGDVLSTKTYHYGDKVTAPANPTKAADNTYAYTFNGWDKTVVACVGDATYTATYASAYIDYTVVFKDWNGTIISSQTYHHGDKVTVPADPARKDDNTYTYTFRGWDKTVVACVGDATYTATYTSTYIDYTVVFKDWNGDVLSTKTYHYGDKVTAPANPTKAADNTYAYTFNGWDKTVVACVGDATYTATYTSAYIDYTVVFKDWNGTIISSQTYHHGDKVTVPADPARKDDNTYTYTFRGWDKTVVDCVGDATYTATYTPTYINYTVVFKDWNGDVLSTKTYHYGDKVTAPANPTKAADNTYTYTFNGWDKTVVACVGDATYTATYTSNYIDYTVTFQYEDGTVIKQYTLHYGDSVAAPATPTVPDTLGDDYKFSGWDKEVTDCQGNAVYTAEFVRKYMFGDLNRDGVIQPWECLKARRAFFGLVATTDEILCAMDSNGNGRVDANECMKQRRIFFGLI